MKFLSPISGINVEHSTNAVLKVQSDSTSSSHLAKIQLSHLRPDGVNYSQSFLGMDTFSTYLSADEGLYLQTNGSTRLFVHGSGNVGIGTTSPASILDINGGSANGLSVQAANAGTEYVLNAKTSNGTSRLWVGGTGAVGIGNTSPNYILDVGGTTRIAGTLHMYGSVRNYSGHFTLQNGAQDANILFKVNDGGTTTTPMMIDGDTSRVGIGTESPVAKLDVAGSVKTSGYFFGDELRANLDSGSRIVLHDGAGNMEFRTQGGTERMTIAYGGNVGIGTSSPLAKLDIVGNQRIVHSSSLAGLEVYTNSAIPLAPQVRIGRDSGQYYGIQVTDGDARLIHRQDEAGTGTHSIINEIWTSTSGGGTWTWRLRENSGAFREDYMTLNSSSLTVAGTINVENASTNLSQANSAGVLKVTTSHGWTNIGPANSSWSHFDTDRAQFYFNKPTEFNGTVKPYTNNNRDLGSSSKQWNRVYGRYIYQDGAQVLSTRAQVHAELYSTGGSANDYTQFGIYRNYAESGPINGHNTILNVMQSDGNYGFQLGANTTADVDGLYYRSKNTGFGGGVWNQIASRSWVQSQGYGDATQAWVQAQGYITSETDSQTLSWSGGNGQLTISNGNTVDLDGRYMTPIYNGADNNSGKADFAVGTGGYGALSLRSNQAQIGGDDMNYTGRFDATSTYVSVRAWDRDLLFLAKGSSSGTNVQHIKFSTKPNGGSGTERVRIDGDGYTYFHGLDLAISNINSDHGKGNYLRGDSTHLVIGTSGTLRLNYGGSTTLMHGSNWYSGLGDRQTNLGTLNTRFENIHAKQIGSQDAGLFFEDTDAYRCIRPANMGGGSADGTIGLGWSNNRWTTIYGNNLDVTSNVKVQGSVYTDSANYSIDLRDHANRTWFRNEVGGWTFQAGTSGDDWTQSFTLYLPAAGTNVNNVYAQLGQRDSNDVTGGRYRGVRIVRDGGSSGVVDGDLIVGRLDVTSNTYFGNDIMIDDNNGTSPSLMFRSGDDTIFQFYKEDNNNTLTITRQDNGGADFRFVADPADYSQSRLQIGTGYIDVNKINSWDAAYGWGNHANAGYLTGSHTHSAADITSGTLNADRLPWSSNDGFSGTYPIVWRATNTPYTASWLSVNGTLDQLNSRRFGSYVGDTGVILQSYNASATNAEQFRIRHNYGNVDIANPRGQILFETRADFETSVVAQTDLYVGNSIQHWGDGGTGMYFEQNDFISVRTAAANRLIVGTDGKVYFGSNTNKGYLREFASNTYGSQIGKIARITFTGGFSDWDSDAHCIVSKDINGNMSDSLSINSYNDITVRLDSNNNNGTSHFYITNNTYGSAMNNRLLDMNTGTNETEIATAFIPYTDRLQTLGRDDRRWQIVFCETLDSAGQHESNLQDEEQPISKYDTGTVLSWKDGKNRPCTQFADHMRMGIAVHGQDSPLIQGAEPVLCTGIVEEGDYLVTSDKVGHAVAVPRNIVKEQMLFDCVIGKALENGDGESHLIKTWINI